MANLLIFLFILQMAWSQSLPPSPCPDVFRYENDGYQWYGVIMAPNPPPLGSSMKLEIKLAMRGRLPSKYVGRIELYENGNIVLQRIHQGHPILYKVYFPVTNIIPDVVSIIFTNRYICNGIMPYGEYFTILDIHHTFRSGQAHLQAQNEFGGPNFISIFNPTTQTPISYYNGDQINYQDFPQNVNKYPNNNNQYLETTTLAPYRPNPDISYQQNLIEIISTRPTKPIISNSPPAVTNIKPNQVPNNIQNFNYVTCGEIGNVVPLINYGEEAEKGDWPWLVALFIRKIVSHGNLKTEFKCGASLVSERLVVTAAHCVVKNNGILPNKEFLLKLGVHDIEDEGEESVLIRGVSEIRLPDEYKAHNNLNDIAVLVMSSSVTFTKYIRPVCLWEDNSDQSLILGKEGKVIGWGQDEYGQVVTAKPKVVTVPIVSTTSCRASNQDFFQYTSNNTICAGSRDGAGPCKGDSGGGLYMINNGKWTLRGVVSKSLGARNTCNLSQFVVYTDCAKYVNWILSIT